MARAPLAVGHLGQHEAMHHKHRAKVPIAPHWPKAHDRPRGCAGSGSRGWAPSVDAAGGGPEGASCIVVKTHLARPWGRNRKREWFEVALVKAPPAPSDAFVTETPGSPRPMCLVPGYLERAIPSSEMPEKSRCRHPPRTAERGEGQVMAKAGEPGRLFSWSSRVVQHCKGDMFGETQRPLGPHTRGSILRPSQLSPSPSLRGFRKRAGSARSLSERLGELGIKLQEGQAPCRPKWAPNPN